MDDHENIPVEEHNADAEEFFKKWRATHDFMFIAVPSVTQFEMMVRAINQAGSTDAVKVAQELEGMEQKDLFGVTSIMRKDDHQLLYPYYEGVFTKDVKYDAEKTGLGWKTEFKTTVADETLPTTCKMKRPRRNRTASPREVIMQIGLISLLDGLVYGMLLFMLASGLTLILSMMGVLNFAHASIYMLGAYFAYQISRWVGFWPAFVLAPLLCGAIGAAIEVWGLRRVHHNGHIAELLFTFGLVFIIGRAVQMAWGMLPLPYRVPASLDFPLFSVYGENFPAYRAFMLLVSAGMLFTTWLLLKKTRIGLIIQAALTHPGMVSALGHNVPRVFTIVFAGGSLLAGLAGVIAGNYFTTESGMADAMGPIVFVVVIFGGLGSLAGCFIASILMGMVQTFSVVVDWSFADLLSPFGITLAANNLAGEILTIPVSRIGPLVPYVLLILILLFRPRGLLGTRET